MISAVDWAETELRYRFSDESLLRQALTHRSASGQDNERLEFLGDAILGLAIARLLYDLKPDQKEGVLTRFRSRLVRRDTLARLASQLGLGEQIRMGGGERRSGVHQRSSVLADALEAVLGAILLDGGYEAAAATVRTVFARELENLPPADELKDAKTKLQEWLQGRSLPPPEYRRDSVQGPPHARTFRVRCSIEEMSLEVTGSGSSRMRAEQAAAQLALDRLAHER